MARGTSALDVPLVMTTLRLFDERGATRNLDRHTRQAQRIGSSRGGLGEAAGQCRGHFNWRSQSTVVAPMTLTAIKALSDSTSVADEHFLFDPWHYHGPSRSRPRAERLASSTHADPDRGDLPWPGVSRHSDSSQGIALRVDDNLRHSLSVAVWGHCEIRSRWQSN